MSPRKSLRIDRHQKKSETSTPLHTKKQPEVAEKAKKPSGSADLNKSKPTKATQIAPKLAEKILKCKNVTLKKKDLIKKPMLSKQKIQLILEKVKNVQKPKLIKKKKEKPSYAKKKVDKPQKIIATKVGFLRQTKMNASVRQSKKLIENAKVKKTKGTNQMMIGKNVKGLVKKEKVKRKAIVEKKVTKVVAKKQVDSTSTSGRSTKKSRVSITPLPKKGEYFLNMYF